MVTVKIGINQPHPAGDLILRENSDGELHIIRADPRILLGKTVIRLGLPAGLQSGVELNRDRLVIRAANRTVIYRIGRYRPDLDAYEASWPD